MRTFRWNAPIIIGAGALVFSVFAPAPLPLMAGESGAEMAVASEGPQLGLSELKARLDRSDRVAAMQALELALVRTRRRRDAGLAAPRARARRQDQAGVGVPRRPRPRVPPRRLFARARHLSAAKSRALPAASPTARGRSRVERGLTCLKSVNPRRLPAPSSRRGRTGHRGRTGGRRASISRLSSTRDAHKFSKRRDRHAGRECSPHFACPGGRQD